jgi:hypothetical protein
MPERGRRYDPQPQCPKYLRRLCKEWAGYLCEGKLYLAERGEVMIPAKPMDEEPIPWLFTPYPHLWAPMERGEVKRVTLVRYPEIAWLWTCNRSVYDCGEVDRFRPGAQAGYYDVMNVGELCEDCNQFKGQRWPWFDYRSEFFKHNREQYLREKYGKQLWLWSL